MMEISLLGILQEGEEIESPRHYAAKIKDLDTYYSYLAWSQIYTHNKNYKKTIEILQEMIKVYPNRPEAYMKL